MIFSLQRALSESVKQYAQRMIDDHTKANEELMGIAGSKGITLPSDMSMMSGGGDAHATSGSGSTDQQGSGQNTAASRGASTRSSDQSTSTLGSTGANATSGSVAAGSQGGQNTASGGTSSRGGSDQSTSTSRGTGNQSTSMGGGKHSKEMSKMGDMHQKHMAVMSRLQNMSGAEFDREYISQAGTKDHEQQAKLFQREARSGGDTELKAFAAKTLPIVQGHLSMARDLTKTIKGGSGSTSGNRSNQ